MIAAGLTDHLLLTAPTLSEAARRLELFDDGLILFSKEGIVDHLTSEAMRLLGLPRDIAHRGPLRDLPVSCSGWSELVRMIEAGQTGDCLLRTPEGREILAAPRCLSEVAGEDSVRIVVLRDLDGLTYRRDRAQRIRKAAHPVLLADNRTRPYFVEQRRLSPDLDRVLSRGERAIIQGARILITGESGVGKTEIAKYLHSTVADADEPLVVANCASTSDAQLVRALFGEEATASRPRGAGLIDLAEGGTLFLDEVAEIPPTAQALLLRFLEDGVVSSPEGSVQRITNVRVIAATNCDLRQLVREGRFRADLYYRLAVVPLRVPPLRDMPALIDHLIDRFLQTINRRRQTAVFVPRQIGDLLADYSFPGNIRELHNIVQKLAVFLDGSDDIAELLDDLLAPVDVPGPEDAGHGAGTAAGVFDLRAEVRRYERTLIDKAIRIHGSKRKAASALGVDIGTISRKTADPTAEPKQERPNKGENKK